MMEFKPVGGDGMEYVDLKILGIKIGEFAYCERDVYDGLEYFSFFKPNAYLLDQYLKGLNNSTNEFHLAVNLSEPLARVYVFNNEGEGIGIPPIEIDILRLLNTLKNGDIK